MGLPVRRQRHNSLPNAPLPHSYARSDGPSPSGGRALIDPTTAQKRSQITNPGWVRKALSIVNWARWRALARIAVVVRRPSA